MTFLSLSHAVSVGGTFALFAGVSVCHFIFTFFLLPETRGKSLEEIEAALGAGAYTHPLFSSTWAVSDTKYSLNTP
jgi:hypothetical protein